jgi:hypothetical protein
MFIVSMGGCLLGCLFGYPLLLSDGAGELLEGNRSGRV